MRYLVFGLASAILALGTSAEPAEAVSDHGDGVEAEQTVGQLLQELGYEDASPAFATLVSVNTSVPAPVARSCVGYTPPPNCTVIFNDGVICAERCVLPSGGTIDGFCDCTAG